MKSGPFPNRRQARHTRARSQPAQSMFVCSEPLEPRRLMSAGDLDTSFGVGGVRTLPLTDPYADAGFRPMAVDVQNGKTVIVGQINSFAGEEKSYIVRLTSSGALDTTFGGGDGIVITEVDRNNFADVVV